MQVDINFNLFINIKKVTYKLNMIHVIETIANITSILCHTYCQTISTHCKV